MGAAGAALAALEVAVGGRCATLARANLGGRAVSQLFTVQVNPAPPSALTPEAPGNSSQPSEGQTTGSEAETPLSE